MKCFCCNNDLVVKNNLITCPTCGFVLDRSKHMATVMPKDNNKHIVDSFLCFSFVSGYQPDVVLSKYNLFDTNFRLKDVQFFYKDRKNPLAYTVPADTVSVVVNKYLAEVPRKFILLSMDGYFSYRLDNQIYNNVVSLNNFKGVPLVSVYGKDTHKAFYVFMLSCFNMDVESTEADTFLSLISNNISTGIDVPFDEYLALYNICTNGVLDYLKDKSFTACGANLTTVMKDRIRELLTCLPNDYFTSVDKFTKSVYTIYSICNPIYAGNTEAFFNPWKPNFVDTGYSELLDKGNKSIIDWYRFLELIVGDYLKPPVVSMEDVIKNYKKFVEEG